MQVLSSIGGVIAAPDLPTCALSCLKMIRRLVKRGLALACPELFVGSASA